MIIRETSQQKRRLLSARLIPLTCGLGKMSLFIAIRIFRAQRDLTVVALVSCVYAYFLDLILFLAQVIMSCVRLTFPAELEFGPQWHPLSPPPLESSTLYTWGPASGCSVLFRLQSYFMRVAFAQHPRRHLVYVYCFASSFAVCRLSSAVCFHTLRHNQKR